MVHTKISFWYCGNPANEHLRKSCFKGSCAKKKPAFYILLKEQNVMWVFAEWVNTQNIWVFLDLSLIGWCLSYSYNNIVYTGRVSNDILAKCNACFTNPCSNEGVCEPLPERLYNCRCSPGYHGNHCQYMIDACYGNPCRNSGTCKLLEEGRFRYYTLHIFLSSCY